MDCENSQGFGRKMASPSSPQRPKVILITYQIKQGEKKCKRRKNYYQCY